MNRAHNRPPLLRTLAILAIAALTLPALATPPTVVSTIPADGDFDVDPTLTKIRVEFDQDMSHSGHSVCGGGDWFPELVGKPTWESARVFIMTVKLKTNHDYGFNINCPAANNFRNTSGEPATHYSLNFATRGGTSDVTPETHVAAYKELRRLIRDEYSYRYMRDVKWGKLFKKFRKRLCEAATPEQFGRHAGRMLAAAKDIHISVKLGDRYFASHSRSVPPNANFKLLADVVPHFKQQSKLVYSGLYPDSYGYILITGWDGNQEAALAHAGEMLEIFTNLHGVIIDVRFNSGGSETLARQVAGYFVNKPVVYAQHVIRDKSAPGGFSPPVNRLLEPNRRLAKFRGKVAVLTGRHVMSSCEAFLLMMKTVPGCKLVGETSYGSSGNPQAHQLPNGVTVFLPCWKAMSADGREFEGLGIPPDIEVKTKPSDFEYTDPVINAALEYLRS